ncbi:EAL domain-containing protein [Mesorhizobium sp. BAC0120]|uniref:EAL domain-containing protein n=1 Tax=Mesorhizobium sp. BAC0120 TaxID=3090670 RepID=UPI00298BEC0B|nr:EAL domain-containing protein [Mesorhizobium sp. BAC0120]MDW6022383.1 EAL domain-containing protein [Mesorhizobium sp. BAC0120]
MSESSETRSEVGTFVDEIGIEIGIYGDWRLKATFRPIFARNGSGFRPVAVEGGVRPFVFGQEVDERMFRSVVPSQDRPIVTALVAALCLRNLEQTGVAGLKLLLDAEFAGAVSPAKARAAVRVLAAETGRNQLEPDDVIVRLSQLAADGEAANAAFASLRARGIGLALVEKGSGLALNPARDGAAADPLPDLVTIDGDWFRMVAGQASTAQLFGALVQGYRSCGALVLVEGVATAGELRVALDSGADWLSGPLLAPAALAGAIFPEDALQIETLLDQGRVIPLFR